MFDVEQPITIKMNTPAGEKTVRVRWPSDDEWIDRQRRRRVIVKQLGRGMSETIVPDSAESDAALLAKIRLDEGGPLDPYEASIVIDRLSQADVDEVERDGPNVRVKLRTVAGEVTHLLQIPSARDVIEYRRSFARVVDLPYNRQEITINLSPAGQLWDKLAQSTDGYSGAVPVVHKAVAVKAAIDAIEAGLDDGADPN
jgi:hypothetical protein